MAGEKIGICIEKNEWSDDVNITRKQETAANFEPTKPLAPGRYILVPQKNTAVTFDIPGIGKRLSKRFVAIHVENGQVMSGRTIGYRSLNAMGLKEKTFDDAIPPMVRATKNTEGLWRAERGVDYIHAIPDHSFIKVQDGRYVITKPTAIKVVRRGQMWTTSYDQASGNMKTREVNGEQFIEPEVNNRFYFYENDTEPTKDEVKLATDAIKGDPELGPHAFLL